MKVGLINNISATSISKAKAQKTTMDVAFVGKKLHGKDSKEIISKMIKNYMNDIAAMDIDWIASNVIRDEQFVVNELKR